MELSLLIMVCIYKSYIIYLETYVVPIGHGFSFLVMEKSWKINVEKRGHPDFRNIEAFLELDAVALQVSGQIVELRPPQIDEQNITAP